MQINGDITMACRQGLPCDHLARRAHKRPSGERQSLVRSTISKGQSTVLKVVIFYIIFYIFKTIYNIFIDAEHFFSHSHRQRW